MKPELYQLNQVLRRFDILLNDDAIIAKPEEKQEALKLAHALVETIEAIWTPDEMIKPKQDQKQ